jgi:glycerol-3-phosphate cytidylyltransferase
MKASNMSRVILTYGTFDLFHVGHLRLLQRARGLGDALIVGVSTDEFNSVKGKKTIISFEERMEIVRSLRCVSRVFPETCWEQKRFDIARYRARALVMGDDWDGKFDFLKEHCDVVYLPRTEGISTTSLKLGIAARGALDLPRLATGSSAAKFQCANSDIPEDAGSRQNSAVSREPGFLLLQAADDRALR